VPVRIRPFHLALLVSLVCVVGLAALAFSHIRWSSSLSALVRRLPPGDATVLYLDLAAVRAAGLLDLLGSAQVDEENDYRDFVEATGFSYNQDLDSVLASFHEFETFLLLKGRFDWRRLRNYVASERGDCYNGFCRLAGSEADRQISFFALTPQVMAMAVGADPWAASLLGETSEESPLAEVPQSPAWITAPGSVLARSPWIPEGTRSLASPMIEATRVTLSLSPADSEFECRLRVSCQSAAAAESLASQLQSTTETLAAIVHQQSVEPGSQSLSDVLTAGEFRSDGASVDGRWPISRNLVRAIVDGAL